MERGDLYYRPNTFPVHVPALRERRADIPLLLRHCISTIFVGHQMMFSQYCLLTLCLAWGATAFFSVVEKLSEIMLSVLAGSMLRLVVKPLPMSSQSL